MSDALHWFDDPRGSIQFRTPSGSRERHKLTLNHVVEIDGLVDQYFSPDADDSSSSEFAVLPNQASIAGLYSFRPSKCTL